jgi:hypothetical protein
MNFHDRLARKAHDMGHRAEVFQALAQSKAGAFWVYLAITGVVWWFAYGYLWLIPAAFAGWRAWESVSATRVQVRLMNLERRTGPTN